VIALEAHAEGTILPVRARAGVRRNLVQGEQAGALVVLVTQAPERGKANQAIIELLAAALDLRKRQFELIAGETSLRKRYLVRGIDPASLAIAVARAIEA
jgi:hypothetical protein